jgi:hypothetical protein
LGVGNGENLLEDGLQPLDFALLGMHVLLDEPLVGVDLHGEEVWHLHVWQIEVLGPFLYAGIILIGFSTVLLLFSRLNGRTDSVSEVSKD